MNPYMLNLTVSLIDIGAAFVIVLLMLETTQHASVTGFLHGDKQSLWAMFRRLVYCAVAVALFAKGIFIFEGKIYVQPVDAAIWLTIIFALLIFPTLRALGIIDQDIWIGFSRRRPPA